MVCEFVYCYNHRSRGFGFVTFDGSDPVDSIQGERPHVLDDKTVDTKRVVPKNVSSRVSTCLLLYSVHFIVVSNTESWQLHVFVKFTVVIHHFMLVLATSSLSSWLCSDLDILCF